MANNLYRIIPFLWNDATPNQNCQMAMTIWVGKKTANDICVSAIHCIVQRVEIVGVGIHSRISQKPIHRLQIAVCGCTKEGFFLAIGCHLRRKLGRKGRRGSYKYDLFILVPHKFTIYILYISIFVSIRYFIFAIPTKSLSYILRRLIYNFCTNHIFCT
jgi:hypothetical protein